MASLQTGAKLNRAREKLRRVRPGSQRRVHTGGSGATKEKWEFARGYVDKRRVS